MKGWLDNFGKADNANDSNVSLPEGFVGLGYNTKGRNYSPAWGGQFQYGGIIPSAQSGVTEYMNKKMQDKKDATIAKDYNLPEVVVEAPYITKYNDPNKPTGFPQYTPKPGGDPNSPGFGIAEFYKSWVSSPEYERRMKNTGYYETPLYNGSRQSSIGLPSKSTLHLSYNDYLEDVRSENMEGLGNTQKPGFITMEPALYMGRPASRYTPWGIEIHPDHAKNPETLENVMAHEIAHAIDSDSSFERQLISNAMLQGDAFYDQPQFYSEVNPATGNLMSNQKDRIRKAMASYVRNDPQEFKSDLQALRFLMFDKGIYDIRKGKEFTKEDLERAKEKLKGNESLERSLDAAGESGFIKLMNIIAKGDEEVTPIAMGGMSIPGSVGFTYARTGSTPSNGKYAKKTMASAQNGIEKAQLGKYIPSWANPMNWGVADYTDKKDFNSAYAAAKKAGEDEFMFNDKRYSTDYKGTPKQEMKSYGITSDQKITGAKKVLNPIRENLANLKTGFGYDTPLEDIFSVAKGQETIGDKVLAMDFSNEPSANVAKEQDALRLYMGLPQRANTFTPSRYKEGAFEFSGYGNLLPEVLPSDEFIKNYGQPLKRVDYPNYELNEQDIKSLRQHVNSDDDVSLMKNVAHLHIKPFDDMVMGRHTVRKGKDERGEYLEYIDKFDFDTYKYPMNIKVPFTDEEINVEVPLGEMSDIVNKPFDIYGRKYYKDYGQGTKKAMYYTDKELSQLDLKEKNFDTLALQKELSNRGYKLSKSTKSDGTLDGVLGEETKKALADWKKKNKSFKMGGSISSAQNGQEMKFYQNGLDWKPKSMQPGGELPLRVSTADPRYPELYKNRQVGSYYDGAYTLPDLPEVVVTGKDERIKEGMSQGSGRFLEGTLGVISAPQVVTMDWLTGKQQTPSEAWGFQNPGGWLDSPTAFGKNALNFGMDMTFDPLNALGVGVVDDAIKIGAKTFGKGFLRSGKDALAPQLDNTLTKISEPSEQILQSSNVSNLPNQAPNSDPFRYQQRWQEKKDEILKHIETEEGRKRLQSLIDHSSIAKRNNLTVDDFIERFKQTKFETEQPREIYLVDANGNQVRDANGNLVRDFERNPDGTLKLYPVDPNNAYHWSREGLDKPNFMSIGSNWTPYDADHVIEHEFGHFFQYGSPAKGIEADGFIIDPDGFLKEVGGGLQDIKLKKEMGGSKFSNVINKLNPFYKETSDLGESKSKQFFQFTDPLVGFKKAKDYFDFGSLGKEKYPMAVEVRENLLQSGILKNRYDEITPEMLKEHKRLYDRRTGDKYYLRLYEIMDNTKDNFKILSDALNKMPTVALPVAGGAAAITSGLQDEQPVQKQKNGGKIKQFQTGGTEKISTSDPRYPELYKNRQVGAYYDGAFSLPDLPEVTVTAPRSYTMDSLRDFTTAALYGAPANAIKLSMIPQAAMTEGIEALRGKPYDFSNVNPNFGGFTSNQRDLSQTMGYENPEGVLQNAANIGLSMIDPLAFVGGTGVRNLARPSKSIFGQLFRAYDPRNLKTQSGLDWSKRWYEHPEILQRKRKVAYGEYDDDAINRAAERASNDFVENAKESLNQYEPKSYIDLLKEKGLKEYFNYGLTTGGLSYGKPDQIYLNRGAYFPFDKQGLESVRVHELSHLANRNGQAFLFPEEDMLLKPLGFENEIQRLNKLKEIKSGSKKKWASYYTEPTEIKARMDQARFDLNLFPEDKFTREMFDKISKKNNFYGMGKYIKDKDAFVDLMNKFWAVPAVGVAVGAQAADQQKNGGITKDNQGYWNPDNWGQPVEIDSNNITMQGVYEPLLGISDTGDTKLMQPGKDYKFKGKKVTEFPVAKLGINQLDAQPMKKLNQLLNFTNNPDKDNWLDKYN